MEIIHVVTERFGDISIRLPWWLAVTYIIVATSAIIAAITANMKD